MPPSATQQTLLSPAELDYLHSSLSQAPPIRPDGRSSTQFRPLIAETDILPTTNGSARICFADGTEAIGGIKAEVEKFDSAPPIQPGRADTETEGPKRTRLRAHGEKAWVETRIEIPSYRDDDALPIFLSAMVNEALLATGELEEKLAINSRFHWRLYVDVRIPQTTLKPSFPSTALAINFPL